MSEQTKAQRLADELTWLPINDPISEAAAVELRRLDEENESLREQNTAVDAACAKLEAANAELLTAVRDLLSYCTSLEMEHTSEDGEHRVLRQARVAINKALAGKA